MLIVTILMKNTLLQEFGVVQKLRKLWKWDIKLKKVYEIYKYELAGDIFSSFVRYFSKLKQESSGFPACCHDENENLKGELID